MRKKPEFPADARHFERTEIDSNDFKNEKAEKPYILKKIFQKILKQTKPLNKISTSKNIGQRNKSNKIA